MNNDKKDTTIRSTNDVRVNDTKRARLMMIISMTIFGTIGLFVRRISVSSGELALYRAVLALVLLTGYLLVTKQRIPFEKIKKEIPLLLFSGIAMGINWILLFEAYKYTTVSVATLSYYFAPVLVTAVCPFIFREKMTKKQVICFVMATVGIVLITAGDLITGLGDWLTGSASAGQFADGGVDAEQIVGAGTGSRDLLGILFGLGAAVFYATVILLNKFIKNVAGIHRTFLQFVSAIIILVPYVALTSGCSLGSLDGPGWVCLLIVGLIHTGVTYCMYFSSLKELPGQKAAILSYIDPLVAVLASVLILSEPLTGLQALGGALILGFTAWNELGSKK